MEANSPGRRPPAFGRLNVGRAGDADAVADPPLQGGLRHLGSAALRKHARTHSAAGDVTAASARTRRESLTSGAILLTISEMLTGPGARCFARLPRGLRGDVASQMMSGSASASRGDSPPGAPETTGLVGVLNSATPMPPTCICAQQINVVWTRSLLEEANEIDLSVPIDKFGSSAPNVKRSVSFLTSDDVKAPFHTQRTNSDAVRRRLPFDASRRAKRAAKCASDLTWRRWEPRTGPSRFARAG